MKKLLLALTIASVSVVGSSACATKTYVKTRVGEVNDKVETVSKSLEETQERTRKNEQAINETNERVGQVDQKAEAAGRSAADARNAANTAAARADAVDKASKRLIYEVTLSEDQGGFQFGKATLPEEATSRLDQIVEQLKANPNGAYIEVAGYTDNKGTKDYNQRLGLDRADAVRKYLYQKYQIPLHKINIISYGAEDPVAPNNTRDGRAKNRRVVIRVLT
jgi:outer membrane protein OmpA-like peptidoglycan-associated protein